MRRAGAVGRCESMKNVQKGGGEEATMYTANNVPFRAFFPSCGFYVRICSSPSTPTHSSQPLCVPQSSRKSTTSSFPPRLVLAFYLLVSRAVSSRGRADKAAQGHGIPEIARTIYKSTEVGKSAKVTCGLQLGV